MKSYLLLALSSIFFIMACRQKVEPPTRKPASVKDMLGSNAPADQEFSMDNETGATITGARGTVISIAPFTYGNSPGKISLTLKEVYTMNEMAGAGVYTSAHGNQVLSSLGIFRLTARRNATEVVPEKESAIKMKVYQGSTPSNTQVYKIVKWNDTAAAISRDEWVENDKNWIRDSAGPPNTGSFSFMCSSWCNLAQPLPLQFPDNHIDLTVPAGFSAGDMDVFFTVDGANSLVKLYRHFSDKTYSTYSIKPDNYGKIVMVSFKDGKYYMKVQDVSFTQSRQSIAVPDMLEVTAASMENLLKSF
jgi:hypothetical protein